MGPVRWGFTARRHGVSQGPYAGFNLGDHVGDDPEAVAANRAQLAQACELPTAGLRFMQQVHGNCVSLARSDDSAVPSADGQVTTSPDLALVVMVADCVPVLLADPGAGVIGVAHAGRPGMVAGVVGATVASMRLHGAQHISAVVGPSICPRCYETPAEMRRDVAAAAPWAGSVTGWGTPAVDVAAGVLTQLAELGVAVQRIPGCTAEEPELFSYRRDGVTGRLAGVVWLPSR